MYRKSNCYPVKKILIIIGANLYINGIKIHFANSNFDVKNIKTNFWHIDGVNPLQPHVQVIL